MARQKSKDKDTSAGRDVPRGPIAALGGVVGTLLLAGLAGLVALSRRRQAEPRRLPLAVFAIPASVALAVLVGVADAGRRAKLVEAAGEAAGIVADAARQAVDRAGEAVEADEVAPLYREAVTA